MTGGPQHAPSVLRGLADVQFTQMVTPRLVGCLYVAAVGFIACGSLVGLLAVWSVAAWAGGGWWWLVPLVIGAGVAGVLAARIACEWVLMAFTRGRAIEPPARPVQPDKPTITRAESLRAAQQRRPSGASRSRPPFPPPAARAMNPHSPQQQPGGSGDG